MRDAFAKREARAGATGQCGQMHDPDQAELHQRAINPRANAANDMSIMKIAKAVNAPRSRCARFVLTMYFVRSSDIEYRNAAPDNPK